jgi:hypothetical protein
LLLNIRHTTGKATQISFFLISQVLAEREYLRMTVVRMKYDEILLRYGIKRDKKEKE